MIGALWTSEASRDAKRATTEDAKGIAQAYTVAAFGQRRLINHAARASRPAPQRPHFVVLDRSDPSERAHTRVPHRTGSELASIPDTTQLQEVGVFRARVCCGGGYYFGCKGRGGGIEREVRVKYAEKVKYECCSHYCEAVRCGPWILYLQVAGSEARTS